MTLSATEVAVPEAVPGAVPAVEDRGDFFEPEPAAEGVRVDAEYNPDILAKLVKEEPSVKVETEEKPDATIPRARFNEVNEENKALKAQLETLKTTQRPAAEQPADPAAQQQTVEDPREKIREMRRQQKDLEVEGDLEAANVLGDQIDDLLLQVATVRAETNIKQSASQETLQSSLEAVGKAAYEIYPFLDIESPKADVDAVVAVRARTTELITSGLSPVEALQKAVDEKGPKFALLHGATTPAIDPNKAEQVRQSRDIQARTTAASASVAQPPVLPGKGEESFTVNIDKMSEKQFKEFNKTEAAARARGDIL
jgi:hypothetical protein